MKENKDNNPIISIIIPVRNNPDQIKECLVGILESSYTNYECIVVDDGSTDNTPEIVQQFPVKVIKSSESKGPAYARNRGAEEASGEILFFIDSDITIYPDTLSTVVDAFSKQPEIDAVIGSYDDTPQEDSFLSQYKNLFHHYIHQNSNEKACTFWSGCGAIRCEVFFQFGGFNTNYKRPAIEDIELGYRLTANNHKIILLKQLQVRHLKEWKFWGLIKTEIFDRGIPWTTLMLRHKIFPNDLNLKLSQRISVVLTFGLFISTIILVSQLRISSSVFLLTLLLGLIVYLSFFITSGKTYLIIWSLIGYIISIGAFIAVVFEKLPSSIMLELFTIVLLSLLLLFMQFKWGLHKFFIRNKRYVLSVCIGYPFVSSLLISVYYHRLSFLPILFVFALILINQNFYKFFVEKRGLAFAVLVVPMHILYYLYCEISFIFGLISHLLGRKF